jgi:hypothetical protein
VRQWHQFLPLHQVISSSHFMQECHDNDKAHEEPDEEVPAEEEDPGRKKRRNCGNNPEQVFASFK